MKCKAIVFPEPNAVELREFELPPCGEQEIIAQTKYSFVSPGTELRVLSGVNESKGRFPLIPGYSWVGQVIEVGSAVKGWRKGEWVTGRNPLPVPGVEQLWGGQCSHHRCVVDGYDSVLKLPAGADPWEYITAEVAAISWRGVTAAYPAPGETAVVVGQGLIGAFSAKWLLHHGARVIALDMEDTRLERARRWGATAINARDDDARQQVMALCDGGADIVVEASASLSGAKLAASILRAPVYRSLQRGYPVTALHSNAHVWPRLVFQASCTQRLECGPQGLVRSEGTVVLKPADRTVDDRLAVIERIREGALPVTDILDSSTPVEQASESYSTLRDRPGELSAVAFAW